MADIFGRTDQLLRGGLSSDSMFMTWPELEAVGGGLGLLIQQVGLSYRQNIRRIFEIGPGVFPATGQSAELCDAVPIGEVPDPVTAAACASRAQPTYYIVSRPEGTLQIGRFIGPNLLTSCFYKKYGSPCNPNVMTMSGKAGCSATDTSAKRIRWILNGVTLVETSMSVTGQEMVVQENLGAIFAGLNLQIEGDNGQCTAPTGTVGGQPQVQPQSLIQQFGGTPGGP